VKLIKADFNITCHNNSVVLQHIWTGIVTTGYDCGDKKENLKMALKKIYQSNTIKRYLDNEPRKKLSIKKEVRQIVAVCIIFIIFAFMMNYQVKSMKLKEARNDYFRLLKSNTEKDYIISSRLAKLEKVIVEKGTVFGIGQPELNAIGDLGSAEVEKKLDLLPESYGEAEIMKAIKNHGIQKYDLTFNWMCFPVESDTALAGTSVSEFAQYREYYDKDGNLKYYYHTGLDINDKYGRKLVACSDGVVMATGYSEYGGNYVWFRKMIGD
jgi:murein DD-endopeptidase MepM/ murein hydrolase activator NlpD